MHRLLVAISAHGLGHLGQAAPVCNALKTLRPDLALTIWSALPFNTLKARITGSFEHIAQPCDLGLIMHDAMRVDVGASWLAYAKREAQWAPCLDAACALVRAAAPDLILSDVGDMPLAAAQALGIPGIAMSSLNWADTARFYFEALPDSGHVLDRLTAIYDNTPLALRLTPGMDMRGIKQKSMPPVGAISTYSRQALRNKVSPFIDSALAQRPKVLIGMGGIDTHLACTEWPEQSEFALLVANQPHLPNDGLPAQGVVNAAALCTKAGLVFTDLLPYCDAVICKPGYGTFVEAALAGIPVLYVEREDWPEQRVLVEWLEAQSRCARLDATMLREGAFTQAVSALLQQPLKAPLPHDGATVSAQEILRVLDGSVQKR